VAAAHMCTASRRVTPTTATRGAFVATTALCGTIATACEHCFRGSQPVGPGHHQLRSFCTTKHSRSPSRIMIVHSRTLFPNAFSTPILLAKCSYDSYKAQPARYHVLACPRSDVFRTDRLTKPKPKPKPEPELRVMFKNGALFMTAPE
jgi:hypothetical protein